MQSVINYSNLPESAPYELSPGQQAGMHQERALPGLPNAQLQNAGVLGGVGKAAAAVSLYMYAHGTGNLLSFIELGRAHASSHFSFASSLQPVLALRHPYLQAHMTE
eukprot:24351-Pelagomonas_calceolata.AAC.4